MKSKFITLTLNEKKMRDGDFIVSKTDKTGIITYCNPIFIEFSGYQEHELIGVQHSIIRHPDMPRSAFALLWNTISKGDEFFGYVKNMSKNGDFYWVFAHISPDFDFNGNIIGYTSVRRCPKLQAVQTIEQIYKQMLQAEKSVATKDAIDAGTKILLDLLKQKGLPYEQLIHLI